MNLYQEQITAAAAGHPEASGWPVPRRRPFRITHPGASARFRSLHGGSSPHATRIAGLARGPQLDGYAVSGQKRTGLRPSFWFVRMNLYQEQLTAAAAGRPEASGWPEPA